jgi:tyrosinase
MTSHDLRVARRVFLCHASADKAAVRDLYRRLVHDGFAPWLDEEDLLPGEKWEQAIRNAIRASDHVVVCLSGASTTKAGYVHREINEALDVADEQPEDAIFVIPARLDDCRVPQRLRQLHWVDLFAPAGYSRLLKAMGGRPRATVPPRLIHVAHAPGQEVAMRRESRALDDKQLVLLQDAFRALQAVAGQDGYHALAGIHGLPPPQYAQLHTRLFLAWNRAYLHFFEAALRAHVPGASLAWWDWRLRDDDWIPPAFTDDTGPDDRANPLVASAIPAEARAPDGEALTYRRPTDTKRVSHLTSARVVEAVLKLTGFSDFQVQVEALSDRVHGSVGGTMGLVGTSAFDPIFWAHRAMVDRLWREWQLRNGDDGIDDKLRNAKLPPFPMVVAQTLDVRELGYDYVAD